MKSPLRKRLPRELKGEIGKYLVVLILMIATIGFVSGFLVADGSMIKAYNEGFEKYKIEDGNFRVKKKITKAQQENIEKNGVTLYENFYLEEALDNGSTMRIFKNREEINLVCLMEGKLPEKAGEMAIDRMYADNNKISVGDTLKSGSQKWKVTGFVALSDYSCLFQNNNDSMFDAIKFGVSVVTPEEFESAFQTAQKETEMAFADSTMYIEHFVENPRHIEFQILADKYGNVIHLGERDCSIQRNHQKMIEESPSAAVSPELREKMGHAAVTAAKAAGYVNAGTIEFLLEPDGRFWFMEMNTRIQVEHPVTEWVTGIDLVKEQLKIASGMPLEIAQEDVRIQGHAIECRINAENPQKNFRPSPGTIQGAHFPGGNGIRVDTCVYNGCKIPPYYDSMLAKLIVHAGNRKEAIAKMQSALGEVIIDGIDTNIDYQYEILKDEDYQSGNFDTGFLASHIIAGVKINEN